MVVKAILRHALGAMLLMLLWASVVLWGTVDGWFHQPIAKEITSQSFRGAVETKLNQHFTGNFALAMISEGAVELEMYHTAGKPVDRNTIFQVSSLSKWVSAVGIMKLVEDGKLDLDAPVGKYLTRWQLPPSRYDNEEVTVRRLLSHTAGLTDGLGYSGFESGIPVQTIEESLAKAADADDGASGETRVGLKPGSAFKYSGGGYTLLQLLVEEVSGQTFPSYMKDKVFTPLHMTQSFYLWSDSAANNLAEFYHADGSKAGHYRYTSLAATSLYTSLADLELFFQAHLTGKDGQRMGRGVVRPETIRKMREPHGQSMGVDIWGLGTVLYATTENGDFIIGHDGKSNPPINTAVRLNPETGDGIIILETGHPVFATQLASEWVFWKTKKVDTFLFPMLVNGLVWTVASGWVLIVIVTVTRALKRNRRGKV